jgi:hypothetical protein
MNELEIIKTTEALEAVNRTEVDLAISTAKAYPRDLEKSRKEILKYATASRETAESCFYHLPRAGKEIEGPSIRLAEIINYSWGNINSAMRIVANDGKKITSQAVAHDLERNNRVLTEVSRNITDKNGKVYTGDMQIVTGNAAGSIAWRNAIFRLIPNAVWIDIQEKIKKFIVGDGKEMIKRRDALLKKFEKLEISQDAILKKLNLATVNDIDTDVMIKLFGVLTAVNEGTATTEEVFGTGTAKNDGQDFADDAPPQEGELPLK